MLTRAICAISSGWECNVNSRGSQQPSTMHGIHCVHAAECETVRVSHLTVEGSGTPLRAPTTLVHIHSFLPSSTTNPFVGMK